MKDAREKKKERYKELFPTTWRENRNNKQHNCSLSLSLRFLPEKRPVLPSSSLIRVWQLVAYFVSFSIIKTTAAAGSIHLSHHYVVFLNIKFWTVLTPLQYSTKKKQKEKLFYYFTSESKVIWTVGGITFIKGSNSSREHWRRAI